MAPPPPPPAVCGNSPVAGQSMSPQFSSPVQGRFQVINYFDHDLPGQPGNGVQLTFCGSRLTGKLDGHMGYDWIMPVGTPLRAIGSGVVTQAGIVAPFHCPVLNRLVSDQQVVEVLHPESSGAQYRSTLMHLSRVDVEVGEQVVRGQVMGLSGNSGCSTQPHLHLEVWQMGTFDREPRVVDPYGWQGEGLDPWTQQPHGGVSIWLWRAGEAPSL